MKHLLSALSEVRKLRPEIHCWNTPSAGFLEGRVASRNTGARNSKPTLSWAQGGRAQAKSNTYCRPFLGLGNCDQKSVAGTLPATDFWRGKLRPETQLAGALMGTREGRAKQNSNIYCRASLGLGNTDRAEILEGAGDCDQKSVAGTLPATDFWRGKLRPETRRGL